MGHALANLPDLVVSAITGVTTYASSNAIAGFSDADVVTIFAPTLTNTHEVQVNADAAAATGSSGWATLTSGGTNVAVASGTAVTITDVAFGALRVQSRGAEAAQRTFSVVKQFLVT